MNITMLVYILATIPIFGWWYARYWKVQFPSALGTALAGIVGSFVWTIALRRPLEEVYNIYLTMGIDITIAQGIACSVAFMFGLGIVVKCFRAVALGRMTEDERAVGMRGVWAWVNWKSLLPLLGFALGMNFALNWVLWWMTWVLLAMLLAYPLVNTALHGKPAAGGEEDVEDMTEERNRVLTLVETGKISGEDAAELIAALGQSRATEESGRMSVGRKVMLLGGLLLLVGLCLPWFKVEINLGGTAAGGIHSPVQTWAPYAQTGMQMPEMSGMDIWFRMIVRAGDLEAKLGWIIVGLGMSVAALPLVWAVDARSRRIHRGISVAAMGVGSVLLLYVVSGVMSEKGVTMQAGVFLVMAGYAVVWAGVMREYLKRHSHSPHSPGLGRDRLGA